MANSRSQLPIFLLLHDHVAHSCIASMTTFRIGFISHCFLAASAGPDVVPALAARIRSAGGISLALPGTSAAGSRLRDPAAIARQHRRLFSTDPGALPDGTLVQYMDGGLKGQVRLVVPVVWL